MRFCPEQHQATAQRPQADESEISPPPGLSTLEDGEGVESAEEQRSLFDVRRRQRRRNKSRSMVGRTDTSTIDEVDLTLHLYGKEIVDLSEEQKSKLRAVVRTHERQVHFTEYHARDHTQTMVRRHHSKEEARAREELLERLPEHANPIPQAHEFIVGVPPTKTTNPSIKHNFGK